MKRAPALAAPINRYLKVLSMKPFQRSLLCTLTWLCLAVLVRPAAAADGHDHGAAAPATGGPALPRFVASSDDFELVGVLGGTVLTLYLDRAADNSPVPDAQIELDIAGSKFKAEKHGDAVYEVVFAQAPKAGVLAITATVIVGKESDLLAGELDVHDNAAHGPAVHQHGWQEYAAWGVGAVVLLGLLGLGVRRLVASRKPRLGELA
jgi:hypothetical protein